MKVKFCPPPDSPLHKFAGVIGDVIYGSLTRDRLSFLFEVSTSRGEHTAQISAEWAHVEIVMI